MNTSPENVSLLMRRCNELKNHPTQAELYVKKLLESIGAAFMFQKGFCAEKRFFIVDFYFPRPRKLCLEVDGSSHDDKKSYDDWRDSYLVHERKLKVIHISNETALALTTEKLKTLCRL